MKLNYIGEEKINLEELNFEEVEVLEDLLKEKLEELNNSKIINNTPKDNKERQAKRYFENKKTKIKKILYDLEDWIDFIPEEYDE